MKTEEKYDLIEKYLEQRMSAEERQKFEQAMIDNPAIKEEIELHRQVTATLKGEKVHELRSVLKAVDKNWGAEKKEQKGVARTINFRRVIAIAATVLLMVMSYQFFFTSGGPVSNEQLFADNFQPYQMLLSQRGLSEGEKNIVLENAISAYSKGNYQSAASFFQQLSQNDPTDISYQFYLAVAQLGAKENDTSINLFQNIISTEGHPFKEQSQWYLALAYLQNGDNENARKTLSEIESGQFKNAEARQILEQLK